MSTRVTDVNGIERQVWDDATRTYTERDAAGVISGQRPYTAEENARADLDALLAQGNSNERTIEQALSDALVEVQTVIDAPNATINAGPAPYIKILARAIRRLIRFVLQRFDGTS